MKYNYFMQKVSVIIVPGNGDDGPEERWRPYVTDELERLGVKTLNVRFPDAMLARSKYWLPFLKQSGADENTILIGHSSGAIAALRYAETNRLLGTVLIGAYHTHLDIETEKQSGYFDKSWNWDAIKKNQKWIIQFGSTDDPHIPIEEMRYLHEKLETEYYEYNDRGHFSDGTTFPELIEALEKKINSDVIIEKS
jgi:uncharacterized protein